MKNLLIGLLASLFLSSAAHAQMPPPPPPQPPRTITVSGESHAEYTPDQAILAVSLVSKDKNLKIAKKNNDALVEKLVAIAKELGIPREKMATSSVNIAPEYRYDNEARQQYFVGYMVSRSLRITMNATDQPEPMLSAIVDAKIDQVNGIEFTLADPAAHEAELRIKAFEDAKAKATALAQAAGGKLGQAMMIVTGEGPGRPHPPMPMMAMAKAAASDSFAPSLPGMIDLRQSVMVMFALE